MKMLGIGVIGAGGFGLFALQQFLQIPGVSLVAMAGTHREGALAMAHRFGVSDVVDVEVLLADPRVQLVYIATPPFLHYRQARAALEAGKHVICEKPLATSVDEADELVSIAHKRDLLCVANLMQRYNPLFESVQCLIDRRLLGECVHGFFENYATDEGLGPDHWFWDRSKSGGIFVEHGVHFFDLFEGWLGAGTVVAAQQGLRPVSGVEEQVQCIVRYVSGPLVNFHHSFTQPARLDRQHFRLLFERGEIDLFEWIPVRAVVRGIVNEAETRELMEILPGSRLDALATYGGDARHAVGRHKQIDVYQSIELRNGSDADKMKRYCELLRAMFRDQLAWVFDRTHQRVITERNGRDSLAMASTARFLSQSSK